MRARGRHDGRTRAVVLGAGIAGLVTARVLRDHVDEVMLVDRDHPPDEPRARRGVPQSRHVHGLLARGQSELERLFPGLTRSLALRGAPVGDVLADTQVHVAPGQLARRATSMILVCASRPLLEDELRRRTVSSPRVRTRWGTDAVGLVTARGRDDVVGVRLVERQHGSAEEVLESTLVVDATGRGSRSVTWQRVLGQTPPHPRRAGVDVQYATCTFDAVPDDLDGALACLALPDPRRPRAAVLSRIENGRWQFSMIGLGGACVPPAAPDEVPSWVRALGVPALTEVMSRVGSVDDVAHHRVPGSVRRIHDRRRPPVPGLVAVGDSSCSLNPVYGQGITAAVLQAVALGDELTRSGWSDTRALGRALARPVDDAWTMAVGADARYPTTRHPATASDRVVGAWLDRVQRAACVDPNVARAWLAVVGLVQPPRSLLTPAFAARVLAGSLRSRGGPNDPTSPPRNLDAVSSSKGANP